MTKQKGKKKYNCRKYHIAPSKITKKKDKLPWKEIYILKKQKNQ